VPDTLLFDREVHHTGLVHGEADGPTDAYDELSNTSLDGRHIIQVT
jgi:hypothetical protein